MQKIAWINHSSHYHKARHFVFFLVFILLSLLLVWYTWHWIKGRKTIPIQTIIIKEEKKNNIESFITSAKVSPELEGYFYKGCWVENPENRTLTNYLGQGKAEDCVRLAKANNFDTVALTNGNHCWGGNHGQFQNNYQKYGQLNDLIGCDFVSPENDASLVYSKSVLGNVQEKQISNIEHDNLGQKKKKELVSNYTYNFYDMPSAEDFEDKIYPSEMPDMITDAENQMDAWKPPYQEYPFPPPELNAEDDILMQGYADIPLDLDYMKEGLEMIEEKKKINDSNIKFPIEIDITHEPSSTPVPTPQPPPLNPNNGLTISREDARMLYAGKPQDYLLRSNVASVPSCSVCGGSGVIQERNLDRKEQKKKKKSCPSCPSCPKCPEPAFKCKEIPMYSNLSYDNIPSPYLSTFKSFGMV